MWFTPLLASHDLTEDWSVAAMQLAWVAAWVGVLFASERFELTPRASSLHAVVVCALVVSLPRHALCFSFGYFVADVIACVHQRDWMFLLHGCLGLCAAYLLHEPAYLLAQGYVVFLIELSTPFLYAWKADPSSLPKFLAFDLAFTGCRCVALPCWLWYVVLAPDSPASGVGQGLICLLQLLNVAWFVGIQRLGVRKFVLRKAKD